MAFNEGILADQRPNFFELLAEESMREALRPALEYIYLSTFQARLFRTAMEITKCNGSFSEYFYSLERSPAKKESKKISILLSIISLVAVPYLKIKIERLHSILSEENDSTPILWFSGQSQQKLMKFLIFKSLPYFDSLWSLTFFIFRICYLMEYFVYYSPLHWLSGTKIVHQSTNMNSSSDGTGRMSSWMASHILSISLFLLRLLQWWYSGEHESVVRKISTLPIPPPPHNTTHIQPSSEAISLPSDTSLCPLCNKPRMNPTTVSTSGFVFCYECISNYIDNHGKCPLTLFPTSRKQLIKLFVTQHQ